MNSEKKPYYITTAIAYANAKPHIGHVIEFIYTDIMARYQRLMGREVFFLTGTDEHGQKISRKATEEGKTPQQLVDEMSAIFQDTAKAFEISNDDFIRTTQERHKKTATAFWNRVIEVGAKDAVNGPYIYKKSYTGLYCVGCESFKTEKELVDGVCPDHKTKPELLEEENYFFKLTAFQERLLELFKNPQFVYPEAKYNEAYQLIKGGLEDVSISRSKKALTWGIPVPGDDEQVMYVWFDALVNYLSPLGFPDETEKMNAFWPVNAHVIGKEINRFHTVLWPAMLMAADLEPPQQVAVHGWILGEGGVKMSKTLGNVLDPQTLLDLYGAEASRYLLVHEVPFSNDGEYSQTRYQSIYDAELANHLGNLVNRVSSMLTSYKQGLIPAAAPAPYRIQWDEYHVHMQSFAYDKALDCVYSAVKEANQYIEQQKPWALAKAGAAELDGVLYILAETVRHIGWMLLPFMPEKASLILSVVKEEKSNILPNISQWGLLKEGTQIEPCGILFPRIGT